MANEISITHALQSLKSGAEWVLRGDVLEWLDTEQSQPTEVEINAEIIRLQTEYDAQEYARNRASAFPSIGDQMDMQYHDLLNSTTTWKDAVAKVKSDNPKA